MSDLFAGTAEELELLAERAAALAAKDENGTGERSGALVVTVAEERYAVPVEAVREVVSHYRVTPVPCAPPAVRGVVNLRGEIVSVTDLGVVLGLRAESVVRGTPLVVVTDGSVTTALLVDSVEDIVEVAAGDTAAPLPLLDRAHAQAVAGSFDTAEGPVALIEPTTLLAPVGAEA